MKYIITIYQPHNPTFRVDENVETYFVDDYKNVYREVVNEQDWGYLYKVEDKVLLENLFVRFNTGNYPADYKGHSLSVGDIVNIDVVNPDQRVFDPETGKLEMAVMDTNAYICCNFGWKKIDLTSNEAYVKAADANLFNQMEGR